ncbi:methyltransferase domain-containing protein [Lachnospiraceae bacterium]|nr:methyltransferase domain-containing protein [Lachnospiraceae bacterium]
MITVLMLAGSGIESMELCIKSFRLFCDVEVSIVIVDDGSTAGLQDWARKQEDVTYVFLDEGKMSWGAALNMVRKELGIDTDILTMDGNHMLTPKYLSRLSELLYAEEDIGAVTGIVCNDMRYNPNLLVEAEGYEEAVDIADTDEQAKGKYALMSHSNAVLWKKGILDEMGEFDENVSTLRALTDDYCIRLIKAEKKIVVCTNALLWCIDMNGQKEEIDLQDVDYWDVLEKKWGMHYFNDIYNVMLIEMIEKEQEESFSVLEIGCDCGATLLEIRNRFPQVEVYGSEINPTAAEMASHVANVVVNDIEKEDLPFPEKKFDYIIFGDVLEHLHNPLKTVAYCRKFLKESGCIIASIPNIMHVSVIEGLLQGDFTYLESGLLDKTHIHFFTYNEIVRMFHEAGYKICDVKGSGIPISDGQEELIKKLLALGGKAEEYMYKVFQYNVKARIVQKDGDEPSL